MSKIIGIIAAAVLVIAAFVAFKNQQAYGKEIDNFRSAQAEKRNDTKGLRISKKDLRRLKKARQP